ncbi:MAG: WD40 repeat domain-containing protein [Methylocella sp.]
MAQSPASLTANVTAFDAGAPVTAAFFLGEIPALALGDGSVFLAAAGAEKHIAAHPGAAILVAAKSGQKLVTGGDDGRVAIISEDGSMQELAREKGKWIDALAARDDGSIAWSCGKQIFARDPKGEIKTFDAPSTVRGVAFLPKGYRIAMSHYNGATAWFPNAAAAPETFEWKGSHLDITASPDGRFLVTSMQENALHAWRMTDKKDLRLSGYPAKPRSLSWSFDGQWLATSGADASIIWPFNSKDGPMKKNPRECGARPVKVSCVAFHPKTLVVAQGYEDGMVLLCRATDGAGILVRDHRDGADAAITALGWDGVGNHLLFGTANGDAGLLAMPA